MNRINQVDALTYIQQGESEFKFNIELSTFTKLQLYLTGQILKGVELFGIGPQEIIRGVGFMFDFHEIINTAVSNEYRVFIIKEGKYFGNGNWYLVFTKEPE
ncbi:MAG: hypothetical protein KKF62_15545 [Bacteroidetes bacterium]|nr:hypothetical protein [Bacteroidota bacterium]MBU1114689.1 hypothetical protein [Bacteroidota bacterium]MBU1798891.1 hypothetical protein [Bacteroidota bacterium]